VKFFLESKFKGYLAILIKSRLSHVYYDYDYPLRARSIEEISIKDL